ncbi:MAG TPA: hypothetical protein VHH35_09230, partial [Pyrinomonadaceae bacterium]|nr:hypothetical protein [Pyrinomonadaceae bacterium]
MNRILRLPLLSERNPTETLGRDTRPKGPGGGGSNGVGGGSLGISRRRARRVFEHKPQELCVAVNGYVQASQLVNSELSELNLNIDLSEDISFVEVFSEQKLRLLLLNVDDLPPAGPGERAQHIEMSDGRTLSLKLEFRSPWPALHVAYHDPTYKEVQALLSGSASEDAPLPFRQDSAIAEQPEVTSRRFSYRDLLIRARALFGVGFWLRPATITSVVALILVAALLFARFTVAPVPTAAELLRQASDAEQVAAARTDTVQHRMITVEVSVPGAVETGSAPQLIARRHVEVWHSGEKGITARRFFDDQNNLIAGEWERGDGRTFYHHGSKPQVRSPQAAIRNFEDAWQLKLSASEFGALIPASQAKVEEQPNAYVISFSAEPANASVAPAVKQATLVLSRADLHATEMTLIIADNGQQAADNGQAANRQPAIGNRQLKKFHFRETSFERRPPSAVAPSVFVPEPELLGAETSTRRNGDVGATAASRDLAVAPSSAVATTELEIEVLDLINQSGADLGDQVSVRRTPEGQLLVQGIVQTDGRKDEVLRALAPVADNPAIKLKVQTVVEALREQAKARQSSRATTVERLESSNDRIAADDDLRRYFAAKGLSSVRLDQAVNQFAARMVDRSLQALRHAGALDRLSQRFSLEQLRTLDPKARNKWL